MCEFCRSCYLHHLYVLLYTFLQLLIDNISRPAPNITHLLLKFDLDTPIERTVLQPKFHYRLVDNLPFVDSHFLYVSCLVVYLLCHFQLLEDYPWNFGEGFKAGCKCIDSRIWFSGKTQLAHFFYPFFFSQNMKSSGKSIHFSPLPFPCALGLFPISAYNFLLFVLCSYFMSCAWIH